MAVKKTIIGPCTPLGAIGTPTATIVYSGANRKGTESTSYTTTVTPDANGDLKATLRTDIFRKLYNLAPFKGWTTSKTGTTVNYSNGATVTLTNGQTLTLYPLYTATDKTVNLGKTSATTISTTAGGSNVTQNNSFTFTISSYISGYKAGDSYTFYVYGQISSSQGGRSYVQYSINSTTAYGTLGDRSTAGQSSSSTKNHTTSVASITFRTRAVQTAGSGARSSTYKAYITKITIS